MNQDIIINELDKLLDKAIKYNEVPVAALLIHNNKIIAKSYNKVEKNNSVLNHAEINVIKKANKILKNWRLDNCELYITLEPCEMCKSIIKKSRIKKVYYYSKQNEYKTENDPNYEFIKNKLFSDKLSTFFKSKR
ncbi:MAG: nucleoside deaminase [Bacilli bacterium]|nr:nucleoside deaminase [Bacilli bacterium]